MAGSGIDWTIETRAQAVASFIFVLVIFGKLFSSLKLRHSIVMVGAKN